MQIIDISANIYNHLIALHKRYYKLFGKKPNKYAIQKHLTKLKKLKRYEFWKKVPSQAIQDITDRIERAYALFFLNRKNKVKCKHPSFKKTKKYKSFTLKQAGYKLLEENKIKIGSKIFKYFKSRDIKGDIKTITVKRDLIGDIYIFITVDVKEDKGYPLTGRMVGFDFGLKMFLTSSGGKDIEAREFFKKFSIEIRKCQRSLSRKKKKSKRREKERIKLSRLYKKLIFCRRDFFFKTAIKIVKEYDYIFLETLNIRAMKRLWGRKISDLSFFNFLNILKYVAEKNNKTVFQIDRFFPSSKKCFHCSYKNENLSLKDRNWICPSCKKEIKRDRNAAFNILREGASSLSLDIVRPYNLGKYRLKLESN